MDKFPIFCEWHPAVTAEGKAAFVLHDSASITDLKDKGEKLEKQKMTMSEKQKFAPEM